jgi:hypothetical protein
MKGENGMKPIKHMRSKRGFYIGRLDQVRGIVRIIPKFQLN